MQSGSLVLLLAALGPASAHSRPARAEIRAVVSGDPRPATLQRERLEAHLVNRKGRWRVKRLQIPAVSQNPNPSASLRASAAPLPLTFLFADVDSDRDFDVIAIDPRTGIVESVWRHHRDGSFSRISARRYQGTRAPDDRLSRGHCPWHSGATPAAPHSERVAAMAAPVSGVLVQRSLRFPSSGSKLLPSAVARHRFGRAPPLPS
jgi:hypothetical protein